MINVKALDYEALCLRSSDIKRLPRKGKDVRKYRVFHDQLGFLADAKTCLVEIEDRDGEVFIADIDTGSLDDQHTMRCLTEAPQSKP